MGYKSVYACNDAFVDYPAGDYFVRIKMQWNNPDKYNNAVLSFFCPDEVKFSRIAPEKGMIIWEKMILNFISDKPEKQMSGAQVKIAWMRSQLVCFSQVNRTEAQIWAKWTFKKDELVNCTMGKGKLDEETLKC